MFSELGELFGWLIVISFGGTLLNYIIKFIFKFLQKKKIKKYDAIMKILMKIFVKNHKYFGFATLVFILLHFLIQFSDEGLNITGILAAAVMTLQVGLGVYANIKKKPRKGTWFIVHRVIAVLVVLFIALHLALPELLGSSDEENEDKRDTKVEQSTEKKVDNITVPEKYYKPIEFSGMNLMADASK